MDLFRAEKPRQGRRPTTRSQKLGDRSQNGSRARTQRKKYGTSRNPAQNRWANTKRLFCRTAGTSIASGSYFVGLSYLRCFLPRHLDFGRFGYQGCGRKSPLPGGFVNPQPAASAAGNVQSPACLGKRTAARLTPIGLRLEESIRLRHLVQHQSGKKQRQINDGHVQ
jgi:hypothetical protein